MANVKNEEYTNNELFDWITGGGAATSMAMLLVSITIKADDIVPPSVTQGLLLTATFALGTAYAIAKVFRGVDYSRTPFSGQDIFGPAESAYQTAMFVGVICFVLGFAFLLMMHSKLLMVPFMAGLMFALIVYTRANNAVRKTKVNHDDKDKGNRP